jgi:DNA-binding transcriptional MerR regulator
MYLEQKIETLEQKVSELSNKVLKLEEKNNELKKQKLFSTNEAAAFLGISRSTLLFHIRNGTIKADRGSSSKYARCKVSLAAIELYMEQKNINH